MWTVTLVADPGFANGGGARSSAASASIEAQRRWGVGPHWERGMWRGQCSAPYPENFYDFRSKNVDF